MSYCRSWLCCFSHYTLLFWAMQLNRVKSILESISLRVSPIVLSIVSGPSEKLLFALLDGFPIFEDSF